MTIREEFVEYVRSLKGVPFQHQGRHETYALDCAGLIVVALWHFDLKPRTFDVTGYKPEADGSSLKAYCDEHMTPIPQEEMQAGDALLVRFRNGPPQHLGILFNYPLQPGKFAMVHADSMRAKAVTETRVEFGRAMQFVAAYQVPGVT